jgi:predicted amidophosphoribosyltransferase
MAKAAGVALAGGDLVLPVPPDPGRRRRPDPTRLLARQVARALGLPCRPRALKKVRASPPQTELPYRERRRALRGAFRARRPQLLTGRDILLVDDVATTLATVESAARALLAAGAGSVIALTFARTPLDRASSRPSGRRGSVGG